MTPNPRRLPALLVLPLLLAAAGRPALAEVSADREPPALLVVVAGPCLLTPAETVNGVRTEQAADLEIGDRVDTPEGSAVEIRLPDRTWFRVRGESTVELESDGLTLHRGGAMFRVATGRLRVAVRGTEPLFADAGAQFSVEVDEGSGDVSVEVFSGVAGVTDASRREPADIVHGFAARWRGRPALRRFVMEAFDTENRRRAWIAAWPAAWDAFADAGDPGRTRGRRFDILARARAEDRLQRTGLSLKRFLCPRHAAWIRDRLREGDR